MNGSDELLEA